MRELPAFKSNAGNWGDVSISSAAPNFRRQFVMDFCLFQINVGGLSLDFFGLVDLALNEAKVVKNFTSLKDSRYSRYPSLEPGLNSKQLLHPRIPNDNALVQVFHAHLLQRTWGILYPTKITPARSRIVKSSHMKILKNRNLLEKHISSWCCSGEVFHVTL